VAKKFLKELIFMMMMIIIIIAVNISLHLHSTSSAGLIKGDAELEFISLQH
jgi:hypothetical protein